MKQYWRISAAAALGTMLVSTQALAIVTVESFINQIEDIGTCDLVSDVNDKCGFTEVTDLSLITAFKDGRGAHEVVGSVRFTAERGQIGGFDAVDDVLCTGGTANYDNGDWDVPDRLFTCSEVVPLSGACIGIDNTISSCFISPDITGRLDSESCSDYFTGLYTAAGPASYGCRLSDFDDPNTDHEDYTFFNYLACNPTADCFQADPIADIGGTCDENGGGPFFVGADTLINGGINDDIWVAGTILSMRLPFGIRLGNTVYPGVMLNGTRQFDFNDSTFSPRINNTLNPSVPNQELIAWPPVVFSYEANHVVPTPAQVASGTVPDCASLGADPEAHSAETAVQFGSVRPKICRGQYSGNDAILVFVPDILGSATTPGTTSSWVIGEGIFDSAKPDLGDILPMGRDTVENCFKESVLCTPLVAPAATQNFCDYETTVCVDIRGAFPALRANSPFELARFVNYTLQVPLFSQTQFTQPNPVVARVTDRQGSGKPTMSSSPVTFPNCDGFNYCFWEDLDDDFIVDVGETFPEVTPGATKFLLIPFGSTGTIRLTEPNAGFIRVLDSSPATNEDGLDRRSTLTCVLPESDSQGRNVADGVAFVYADDLMSTGGCDLITPPVEGFPGTEGILATVSPIGVGLTGDFPIANDPTIGTLLGLDYDQFVWQITQPSISGAATITFSGFELLVADDSEALPGGIGCIEVACTLRFPGEECGNHEGIANDDSSGNPHLPQGGGLFSTPADFPFMPIACIVPGRTVLLYPYLVKSMGFDTGVVVTNTAASEAIVHFYLFEEEGRTNIATNPPISILVQADPERLVKGVDLLYNDYNEIPRFGQYVNLIFEVEGDPNTGVPKNSEVPTDCANSSGIFPHSVLESLNSDPDCNDATPDGRVWLYAVVQQCYSHGYQMVFSEGGFGSTLALVDNETVLTPVAEDLTGRPRDATGKTTGTRFIPVHTAPARFISIDDVETRRYRFWTGNDQ